MTEPQSEFKQLLDRYWDALHCTPPLQAMGPLGIVAVTARLEQAIKDGKPLTDEDFLPKGAIA